MNYQYLLDLRLRFAGSPNKTFNIWYKVTITAQSSAESVRKVADFAGSQ